MRPGSCNYMVSSHLHNMSSPANESVLHPPWTLPDQNQLPEATALGNKYGVGSTGLYHTNISSPSAPGVRLIPPPKPQDSASKEVCRPLGGPPYMPRRILLMVQ